MDTLSKILSLSLKELRGYMRLILYGRIYDSSNPNEILIEKLKTHFGSECQEEMFMKFFHENCLPICTMLENELDELDATTAFCFLSLFFFVFEPPIENKVGFIEIVLFVIYYTNK